MIFPPHRPLPTPSFASPCRSTVIPEHIQAPRLWPHEPFMLIRIESSCSFSTPSRCGETDQHENLSDCLHGNGKTSEGNAGIGHLCDVV